MISILKATIKALIMVYTKAFKSMYKGTIYTFKVMSKRLRKHYEQTCILSMQKTIIAHLDIASSYYALADEYYDTDINKAVRYRKKAEKSNRKAKELDKKYTAKYNAYKEKYNGGETK